MVWICVNNPNLTKIPFVKLHLLSIRGDNFFKLATIELSELSQMILEIFRFNLYR